MSEALSEPPAMPQPGVERIAIQEQIREWRDLAACKDANPDEFFEARPSGRYSDSDHNNLIGRFCIKCHVADDCLAANIKAKDTKVLVAGGLITEEREPLIESYKQQLAQKIDVPVVEVQRRYMTGRHKRRTSPRAKPAQPTAVPLYNQMTEILQEQAGPARPAKRKNSRLDEQIIKSFWERADEESQRAVEIGVLPSDIALRKRRQQNL
jgi:hypothetical protein